MHFPIIVLEDKDKKKEDWTKELSQEDATLVENTDYYGDRYTNDERKNVIASKWLENFFEGIAIVNVEDESITFLDFQTIKKTLRTYYREVAKELTDFAEDGYLSGFIIRQAGKNFRDSDTLFVFENCGLTSMQFIEDAPFYAGKTYKIGNIFDAHV